MTGRENQCSLKLRRTAGFLSSLVPALLIVGSLTSGSAYGDHFRVEVELLDGRALEADSTGNSIQFGALAVTGKRAQISIQGPPSWSNVTTVCQIEWVEERKVYVIRNFNWTGEFRTLWDTLLLSDPSGKPVQLEGSQVRKVRFTFTPTQQQDP